MSTHIAAEKGQIAESILLPGDPLRAQFIAENYLEEPVCFNKVRNMFGFTGRYKGERISVMGTGMGMPSHSIYVNELIREYGCRKLIRIGTCGSLRAEIKIRDLILGLSASTDSAVNKIRFQGMDYAPAPSYRLLRAAHDAALAAKAPVHVGKILSSDSFYTEDPDQWKLWARFGVLGVEMETAELYTLAAKYDVEALAILTVSDHLVTHEATPAEERETRFRAMAEIAFQALLAK
ncbi:MAG: purine-nucleoside phosphorylase [Spirochaetaceae bacterium]|nr:purine-nucleoside phosphorylase [Spirochaetaceae bacterium]